jgi:acyl-CoA thioesterase-1
MATRFRRFSTLIIKTALKYSLLLFILLTGTAHAGKPTILILGDSISAAYGMSVEQGWVALFEGRIADEYPNVELVNASISGETTGGGLRRLPQLLASHKPQLVVLELGANDGLRGFPIKTLRGNLNTITKLAQEAGARVLLVQMEIPPNYGSKYTLAFHDSYALVAKDSGSVLSPFLLDGVAGNPTLIQSDGIHPTASAQPRMLENILPSLLAELEQFLADR